MFVAPDTSEGHANARDLGHYGAMLVSKGHSEKGAIQI